MKIGYFFDRDDISGITPSSPGNAKTWKAAWASRNCGFL